MTGRCTAAALAAGVVVLVASAASAADPGRTAGTSSAATVTPSGQAALNLVFVLDGLRPDSISETETPTIARLRRQGVEFTASHAVTPTVTRVNASAIGSGYYPGRSGIVGNAMYVPEVDPHAAFSTGDATQLLRLGELTGRVVLPQTLGERMEAAVAAGVGEEQIVLDPGPDFAKTPAQTVAVLRRLDAVVALGRPVLLAVSRKDFVGALTGRGPRERGAGTLAAVGHGLDAGAHILRVHDVAAAADFLAVRAALRGERELAPGHGLTPDRFPASR